MTATIPATPRARRSLFLAALLLFLVAAEAHADITFRSAWQAASAGDPTGVGWADVDGDGSLDLVVTQGIDARHAPNLVYFNRGGVIDAEPGWTSADTLASGNLVLLDLDGDGDRDLACSSLGHQPSGRGPEPYTVYRNDGGFPAAASWYSPGGNAFSMAAGDPDNDGDADLVFGQGFAAVDPADAKRLPVVIFRNDGHGDFGDAPGWASDSSYITVDVAFADIDADGDHDLAVTGRGSGISVFLNRDGRLETTPSWHTAEILGARQIAFGDVDGDGYPDLAACAVVEYGRGGGSFVLFRNRGGTLEKKPSWTSHPYPEPAAVAFADVDGDGDLDLGGGGWTVHVGVFENRNGVLTNEYVWMNTPGWLEQIAWGDFDEDGLAPARRDFTGDGRRGLFDLGDKAIHEITSLRVDGADIPPDRYAFDPAEGWISLAEPPSRGAILAVDYVRSGDLDLAVTTIGRTRVYENEPYRLPAHARLLLLVGDEVGANVNFSYHHELLGPLDNNILNHFRNYGWEFTIAGVSDTVDSCAESGAPYGAKPIVVDRRVDEIRDLHGYDALIVLPGSGHQGLIASPDAMRLVREAKEEGIVVGAWCRGVKVLAAAGVIQGRRVAGHEDDREAIEAAGAEWLGKDVPPVVDGPIVTSVRSRYYRTEMCEAIGDAITANRKR